MTSASSSATDSLTVNGNYVGNNGQMALQSVLGGDGSASDRLVVNQGTLQGSTTLIVSNLGGWRRNPERWHSGGPSAQRRDRQ